MAASRSTSGNAVVLVLIGVALFGALAYTFMRGAKQGTGNLSKQQARVAAQEIIAYGQTIERGVAKLRERGCSENQFDFTNTIYLRANGTAVQAANSNSPVDDSCDLFSASGAGISPNVLSQSMLKLAIATGSSPVNGHGGARVYQVKGVGTDAASGTASANDLVWQFWGLSDQVCETINDLVDVVNTGGNPPVTSFTGAGSYTNGSMASTGITNEVETDGKIISCVYESSTTTNIFRYVLMAR